MLLSSTLMFLTSASTATAWSHLFDRAPPGCLADNCLRALTGTQPGQVQTTANRAADCSNFLKTVPVTVTVTATATFVASSIVSVTTTTTTTAPRNAGKKRGTATGVATGIPAYASACSSAARYSSACSCAGWLPQAQTVTKTISSTSTRIVSTTSTQTNMLTPSSPPSTCNLATLTYASDSGESPIFNRIFSGTGFTESPSNPSNDDPAQFPPRTTTFPSTLDGCGAASACIQFAFDAAYFNLDVHFLLAENVWECVVYDDGSSAAGDYSVANADVGVGMGYQFAGWGPTQD